MFTVNLKVPRHKIIHTGSSKWTFVVIHPQVGKFEEEKIYKKEAMYHTLWSKAGNVR